jgi:hypothetical protein
MNSRRALVVTALLVGGLALAAFAVRRFMIWEKTRDVLPAFSPVPLGPRAPFSPSLLGHSPGRSTLAAIQAQTALLGWPCRDTSMRGLMQAGRAEARARVEAARARGDDPDTVAGASRAGYYSKKEQNPQVQWTCEDVDVALLPAGEAYAGGPPGTVVFVFDSGTHPLRHIMVSRRFQSQREAVRAREEALARHAALGAPTSSIGSPELDPNKKAFERLRLVATEWSFADRRVVVSVMNGGPGRGIDVRELVEVPWPVSTTDDTNR